MGPYLRDYNIHPPILNSASPWATTEDNLHELLLCDSTGAITTRTCLLEGFDHNESSHRYVFFDPTSSRAISATSEGPERPMIKNEDVAQTAVGSLNSLGYSPISLGGYLRMLEKLSSEVQDEKRRKPVVISVTGTPEDVAECYEKIVERAPGRITFRLAMEINLSCPNIPNAPPPAYDEQSLVAYLRALPNEPQIPIGIKSPPYTFKDQFVTLISALRTASQKISFITATNTLGSCLLLSGHQAGPNQQEITPILPDGGVGGMAGPPLHPLALGNVATIRRLLVEHEELRHVSIVGVGGVMDGRSYRRMRAAGADYVSVGTGLGRQGVGVFKMIGDDVGSQWYATTAFRGNMLIPHGTNDTKRGSV